MRHVALGLLVAGAALASAGPAPAQSADSKVGGKTLDEWIKDVETSKDASTRERAIQAIMQFGPNAVRAVPALVNLLRKGEADTSPRVNAVIALGGMPVDDRRYAQEIVAELRKRMQLDSQGIVRFQAVRSLGVIAQRSAQATSPTSKDVMAELRNSIDTLCGRSLVDPESWEIRRAAAAVLGVLAPEAAPAQKNQALAALYKSLRDHTAQVRLACAQSIIQLGQPARPEDLEALKKALLLSVRDDVNKAVAIWSRVALMRLDEKFVGEKYLTAIGDGLKARDQATQLAAAAALAMIGRSAAEQLPALITATDADDPVVVAAAAAAMGQIGSPKALPALEKLRTGHRDDQVRFTAADAIERINGVKK